MSDLLRIKRGMKADLPELMQGELGFCLDTQELFIGGVDGNVLLQSKKFFIGQAAFYGVKPDGVTDYYNEITQCIEDVNTMGGGLVILPIGHIKTSKPIELPSKVKLCGQGISVTIIEKTTNTVDSKGVDSVISIVNDEEYVYYSGVEKLTIIGKSAPNRTVYGIYAPKTSQCNYNEVYIKNVDYGYCTFNSWMTGIYGLTVQDCVDGIRQLPVNPSNTESTSGTSLSATRIWVTNFTGIAYNVQGLSYSCFTGCGADNGGSDLSPIECYSFKYCYGITLNGCGAENIHGKIFYSKFTRLTINNTFVNRFYGITAGQSSALVFDTESNVVMNSCTFGFYTNARNSFNMIVNDYVKIVLINTLLPKGGQAYTFNESLSSVTSIGIDNDDISSMVFTESDKDKRSAVAAFRSSNITLNAGNFTDILFDTEEYDNKSEYDPSTGYFTTKMSGLYQFTVALDFGSVPVGARVFGGFYQNGIGELKRFFDHENSGSTPQKVKQTSTIILKLSKGAQIKVQAYCSVNHAVNGTNLNGTFIQIVKLG